MAKTEAQILSQTNLSDKTQGYKFKIPKLANNAHLMRDQLQCRVDFYMDTTVLFFLVDGVMTSKVVSARELTMALLSDVNLNSGLLPENTLFWSQTKNGVRLGLWRPPQVTKVALMLEAFKQPRRFKLPMPGLVFICEPGRPPAVYAAKRRPVNKKDMLYHAPVFNVYAAGNSCEGTHKYPNKISDIPDSFFRSFFTKAADPRGRSKKYPQDLLKLWEELDGQDKYPLDDLVQFGPMEAIMK